MPKEMGIILQAMFMPSIRQGQHNSGRGAERSRRDGESCKSCSRIQGAG
jgi:hypothetical protein